MIRNTRKEIKPVTIFMQADGFSLAYNTLSSIEMPIHQRMHTGSAMVVLSAFASELFLKCLICIETGRVSRGHHLKELFDQLEIATRKRVCAQWEQEVVPLRDGMWRSIEGSVGKPVPRDLPSALQMANKAFERVRYAYEEELDGLAYTLSDLPTLLRRIILERHPEWRNLRRKVESGTMNAA